MMPDHRTPGVETKSWRRSSALALVGLLFFMPAAVTAVEPSKPVVAVFDIEVKRATLDREAISALTDFLAGSLAATGEFQVVPREQIKRRLSEQKKESYRECYDSSCQIELGRELAAEKTLATQVLQIGKSCVVTVSLYDLRRAATEGGATFEGACTEEGLMASLKAVLAKLQEACAATKRKQGGVQLIETRGDAIKLSADYDPKGFDALGFFPRAQQLARQIMPDAILVDFSAEGVFPDGHADLTLGKDFRADFVFRSPERSLLDPKLPRNIDQDIRCLVHVEVSATGIEVFSATSNENCREKPRPAWKCSLKEAWKLAAAQGAPQGMVAKVSWLWDGWFFDFGKKVLSVTDGCR